MTTLERLRALSEAATPGPWFRQGTLINGPDKGGLNIGPLLMDVYSPPDARLIVAAVNYVRDLLARDSVEADPLAHRVGLPPGPYRVERPAEQGGAFTLWGRQGTPPDFKDGWAIPLVARGVDVAMFAICHLLNARDSVGAGLDVELLARALAKLGYPPVRELHHSQGASGHYEHDNAAYAQLIAAEYARLAAGRLPVEDDPAVKEAGERFVATAGGTKEAAREAYDALLVARRAARLPDPEA